MQKKKILYVITKGNWGGAQRYVFDLAANLPRDEFETVVACGASGVFTEKLRVAGIRIVFLPSLQRDISFGRELKTLGELVRLFKKEKPDIIHLNSSKAAGLGALASRLYNLSSSLRIKDKGLRIPKIIFTVHGWPFNEPRNALVRALLWLASALTALLATCVITLSRGDFAQGARMLFIKRKLRLIRNGIAETKMLSRETARANLATVTQSPLSDSWIGVIAELNRNKGIAYLVEACAQLTHRAMLCIIGDGEEKARLEALTKKLDIAGRVLFVGFKKNAEQYLQAFDVCALPSLKEGLPYSILEAGAAGLPVVATNLPGIREIISGETYGILVPPKDVAALAHALALLIDNPAKRAALGENLAARIRESFSFSAMLQQTTTVYTNVPPLNK